MENQHELAEHKRVVGLDLHQQKYYLCFIDLGTGKMTFASGSLRIKTGIDRLVARIEVGDLVLLQDDSPLSETITDRLRRHEGVMVLVGRYDRLGAKWVAGGAKRGRVIAKSLAEYLLETAQDKRPEFLEPASNTSTAKRLLHLGLYMQELAARTDRIRKNLDDLMEGRNLESSVKKALDMEISYREPLTVDGMKIPSNLAEALLPPDKEVDDGSFLAEYQKLAKEIKNTL